MYRVQALACVFAQAQPKGCTLYACSHGDHPFPDRLLQSCDEINVPFFLTRGFKANPGLKFANAFSVIFLAGGEINFTHAAGAEQRAKLIATESRTWLDDHNR